jgi:hypothetical protein
MGWKGLIRDTIMFAVGIGLLLGWLNTHTAVTVLIATAAIFTVYAWLRFFKG